MSGKHQQKRMASRRPHKAAARHSQPAWKLNRVTTERFVTLVIDERRNYELF